MTDSNTAFKSIDAELVYAVDTGEKLINQTMHAGDMSRVVTGTYEMHPRTIRNGRLMRDEFSLDRNGFVFCDHPTKVTDFFDADQVSGVYYGEACRLVAEMSGASRVEVFDHTVRSSNEDTRKEKLVREPVHSAHNDYTENSGPRRVQEIFPDEAAELLTKRFAIIQVWRAINKTIEVDPLTICDARTFRPDDLITAERRYPHRVGETYRLAFSPGQEWYYFPHMTRDEALVFKVYDSDTSLDARFTPHTSFTDPTSPKDGKPRESIEIRTFAFFD
ncbi:MAG: methyltransferase [Alphaproteobacteria bacterium]|nr:methyltransferase [Alphaproteobacteria bacterium]|tara:strand:- start:259 stop:1086 length:828 start_codon:yes stop_codon:yes gene_type:complete